METATLGGGCFWCTEAIFLELKGVESVVSGYSGGKVNNPSYQDICTGQTGHAEVIEIEFDPNIISFQELLEVFWSTHDPTSLNRQGGDIGTQYRSVIFYMNDNQKEVAKILKKKLEEEAVFNQPIVTEISPRINFFKAENYHQNYYKDNQSQGYCQFIIVPKLDKFRKIFKEKLK